jgi:hypothetical protein
MIEASTLESSNKKLVIQIADVCFEMFSIKELRRPIAVLHELAIAFPEATSRDFQDAIQLAISWRLALKGNIGLAH